MRNGLFEGTLNKGKLGASARCSINVMVTISVLPFKGDKRAFLEVILRESIVISSMSVSVKGSFELHSLDQKVPLFKFALRNFVKGET